MLWESVAAAEFQGWLDDLHKQHTDSESGGRLALYKLYKSCPKPEEYILKTISLNRRGTIAQIKCGCLPLELETGRYRSPKTPLSQRICQLCNSDVEDETHFLMLYPMLNHIRIKLFKDMQNIIPGFLSFQPIEKCLFLFLLLSLYVFVCLFVFGCLFVCFSAYLHFYPHSYFVLVSALSPLPIYIHTIYTHALLDMMVQTTKYLFSVFCFLCSLSPGVP